MPFIENWSDRPRAKLPPEQARKVRALAKQLRELARMVEKAERELGIASPRICHKTCRNRWICRRVGRHRVHNCLWAECPHCGTGRKKGAPR